jgi:hypothetical protein
MKVVHISCVIFPTEGSYTLASTGIRKFDEVNNIKVLGSTECFKIMNTIHSSLTIQIILLTYCNFYFVSVLGSLYFVEVLLHWGTW